MRLIPLLLAVLMFSTTTATAETFRISGKIGWTQSQWEVRNFEVGNYYAGNPNNAYTWSVTIVDADDTEFVMNGTRHAFTDGSTGPSGWSHTWTVEDVTMPIKGIYANLPKQYLKKEHSWLPSPWVEAAYGKTTPTYETWFEFDFRDGFFQSCPVPGQ